MSHDLGESFREELQELLELLEASLLALEAADTGARANPERVGDAFRAAHNIKGAAAMLGLKAAADAAHAMESVLDEIRSAGTFDRSTITRLLGGVDALRALTHGSEAAKATKEALFSLSQPRDLRLLLRFSTDAFSADLEPLSLLRTVADLGTVVAASTDTSRLPPLDALDPEQFFLGFELVLRTTARDEDIRSVFAFAEDHLALEIIELPAPEAPPDEASPTRGEAHETLFVSVRRVDTLVDLAAEMSVAVGHLEQLRGASIAITDGRMEGACREVKRLASRLQEAAMAIRLVPLGATFAMLRRFVRDQALRLGKDVIVELKGAQTELDKSVAERLLDPLQHLVRNALDHGIESPAERAGTGKPSAGRLVLSALQEQGEVVVVVEDDGRGLDPDRLREAALRKGLLAPDAKLSEAEALDLVFLPGFSTALYVGELSGRGVGLDVVRRNVLALGGATHVDSKPGKGTRFSLSVPLTLAVLEGLVLRCGDERMVVPIDRVERLLRPTPRQITRLPDGREVLLLPDRSVPLLSPAHLFGAHATRGAEEDVIAVVVHTPVGLVALHVGEVFSQEAVMLKPLQRNLRVGREGVLGATVLSDGAVALVLDVARLTALGRPEHAPRPLMLTNDNARC